MAVLSNEVAATKSTEPPPRKKQCLSLSSLRNRTPSTASLSNSSGCNMSLALNASKNGHEGRSEEMLEIFCR